MIVTPLADKKALLEMLKGLSEEERMELKDSSCRLGNEVTDDETATFQSTILKLLDKKDVDASKSAYCLKKCSCFLIQNFIPTRYGTYSRNGWKPMVRIPFLPITLLL